MRVSISVRPQVGIERIAAAAEAQGYDGLWLYDVHRTFLDPYPLLGVVAHVTRRIRFGPCVSNPVTRDPTVLGLLSATLRDMSGGRMDMGLARGDAAVVALGRHMATLSELRAAIDAVRAEAADVPIWIGTYGPKGLRLCGEAADGVMLQFADPTLVRWAVETTRAAQNPARAAVRMMVACPVSAGLSPDEGLAHTRWFGRMIARDVATVLRTVQTSNDASGVHLSADWFAWADSWHTVVDAQRAAAEDTLARLSTIGGTVAEGLSRVRELAALGVEELNIFTLDDEIENMRRLQPFVQAIHETMG